MAHQQYQHVFSKSHPKNWGGGLFTHQEKINKPTIINKPTVYKKLNHNMSKEEEPLCSSLLQKPSPNMIENIKS